MAGIVQPDARSDAYRGLSQIFEFTNSDGELQATNCGQAAVATLFTHHLFAPQEDLVVKENLVAKDVAAAEGATADVAARDSTQGLGGIMSYLEKRHPPDNFFGLMGTSRIQVKRACRAQGVKVREIRGEGWLRRCLTEERPVIVMLQVSAGQFWGWDLPGGHWMVAYGFDEEHIYLTNWGKMTWAEFRSGWNGLVPRLIGMRNRGLISAS
jgi:hypothetical protein